MPTIEKKKTFFFPCLNVMACKSDRFYSEHCKINLLYSRIEKDTSHVASKLRCGGGKFDVITLTCRTY